MVQINTRIPEELKARLKKRAEQNKRTLSGELYAILDDLLRIPVAPQAPKYPLMPPAYPLPSTSTTADPEPLLPVGWND